MRFTIHAGLHKTGSTSIQVFCDIQEACLSAKKVFYPEDLRIDGAHHIFVKYLVEGQFDIISKYLKKWIIECTEFNLNHIVVSSEDFEYVNSQRLSELILLTDQLSLETSAIIYIRPQAELITSQYSQQVREGAYIKDFQVFLKASLEHGEYIKLEKIIEGFYDALRGRISVIFYYNELLNPINSVIDFSGRIGIDNISDYTDPDTYQFNSKLSTGQLMLIRMLVAQTPELKQFSQYEKSQLLFSFHEKFDWPDALITSPKLSLTIEQLIECEDFFCEENKRLASKYFDDIDLMALWYQKAKNDLKLDGINHIMLEEICEIIARSLITAKELISLIIQEFKT